MRYGSFVIYSLILCSILQIISSSVLAMPAVLEAINGTKMKVILQHADANNLDFKIYQSNKNMSVPISKVARLDFILDVDVDLLNEQLISNKSNEALEQLCKVIDPYFPFMRIENNLHQFLFIRLDVLLDEGRSQDVYSVSKMLQLSSSPTLALKGVYYELRAALKSKDTEVIHSLMHQIKDPAALLYFNAEYARMYNNPKEAMLYTTKLLTDHPNTIEWIASAEMLAAELYLEMQMTNSAIQTARQVSNIYSGTMIAVKAEELYSSLKRSLD